MYIQKCFSVLFALISIAGLASASGTVYLNSCANLNQSNTTYILNKSVSSAGTCFSISSNNVVLDCNGKSVSGINGTNGDGILVGGVLRATVKNCPSISNFRSGITLFGAINSSIFNIIVPVSHGDSGAITVFGGYGNSVSNSYGFSTQGPGITVSSSPGSAIAYSQGMGGNSSCGIIAANGQAVSILGSQGSSNSTSGLCIFSCANCYVANSSGYGGMSGIYIDSSSYCLLEKVNGSSLYGNGLTMSVSDFNTIKDSKAFSSAETGLWMDSSNNNTMDNLAVTSQQEHGITATLSGGNKLTRSTVNGALGGVWLSDSDNNLLAQDSIQGGYYQALLIQGSSGNTVANSTVYSNSIYSVQLEHATGNLFVNNSILKAMTLLHSDQQSYGNSYCWNTFSGNGIYVNDTSGYNLYSSSACNGEGNLWGNVLNGSVKIQGNATSSGFPGYYVGSSGSGYPYNAQNSQGKVYGNVTDSAPLTPFSSLGRLELFASPANGGSVYGAASNFVTPSTLPILAVPNQGAFFLKWSPYGDCTVSSPTAANTTVTVNSGVCKVKAAFIVLVPSANNTGNRA